MSSRRVLHSGAAAAGAAVIAILVLDCTSAFAISSTTLRVLSGQAANDQFGTAVAPAGDFNHDGFPDVIVGAPFNDAAGSDAGRAYVFYGGPDSKQAPDTLYGEVAGGHFGTSVAAAGDWNGDGNDDVIVGASAAGGTGRAYVFFGGPNPGSVAGVIIYGVGAGDFFGDRVASAGDWNADGFDDVVVGAPLNDAGGVSTDNRGRAYVYFGGPSPNNVADVLLTGQAAGDHFGVVQSGGDFDGDGIDDLFVGAPFSDGGATSINDNRGRVYLFRGGITPNALADLVMTGAAPGDNFGQAVGIIIYGHGTPEVIVGAPSNDAGGFDAGRAYVYLGGATADTLADATFTGSVVSENLGYAVAMIGDINEDGYDDFATGSPTFGSDTGRMNVYFGGPFTDSVADLVFNGTDVGVDLGWTIAAVDLDRDDRPELIAGAPNAFSSNPGTVRVLSAYTFDVVSPGEHGATWPVGGAARVRWLGHDIADLALSTDGGLNFTVMARGIGGRESNSFDLVCPDAPTSSARVRLTLTGQTATRSNSDLSPFFRIVKYAPSVPIAVRDLGSFTPQPPPSPDSVGGVIGADITADGTDDIMIGDPGIFPGSHTGGVTMFADSDDTPQCGNGPPFPWWWRCSFTFHGRDPGDLFGYSLATIGDFNGDGFVDWIVGAPRATVSGNASAGKAYVYFGGATLDTVPDLTLTGAAAGDQFGFAVASAGDFNLDGFADVAVSAPFNAALGPNSGRVYVYYGGIAPNAVADLVLDARSPGENFGYSLAGGINLNQRCLVRLFDPQPDPPGRPCDPQWLILVGAPANDVGGTDAGAAYEFRKGAADPPSPDIQLFGDQAGAKFGWSVAGVGDINGDDVQDIAIGAPGDDGHGIDAGQVSVFTLQAPPEPEIPCAGPLSACCSACQSKRIFFGERPGDRFGTSIASMDFNQDGLSDIVIGAPGFEVGGGAGKVDAGRIYGFAGGVIAAFHGDPLIGDPDVIGDPDAVDPTPNPWFAIDGQVAGKPLGKVVAAADPGLWGGKAAAARLHPARLATLEYIDLNDRRPYVMGPTPEMLNVYDINRFHLLDNMAGVEWQVGSLQKISWFGNAAAQVELSIDGGHVWQPMFETAGTPGLDGTGPTGSRHTYGFRVPHVPTKFASVRIWPSPIPGCLTCPPIPGGDVTDTVFTIRSNINLLSFTAQLGSEGASLAWSTDVGVSDQGIAGYRLYRLTPGARGPGERIGPERITESHFTDPGGAPGLVYRLVGVNGLAEELELGKVTLESTIAGLRVSPSPTSARGSVTIAFAAPQAVAGISATDLEVGVFDVSGRRVAQLARGDAKPDAGVVKLTWNPARGESRAGPGLYFVRVTAPSAGFRLERKVVVLP